MSGPRRIGEVSFWYRDIGGAPAQRPPLDGDCTADVCIVGAGYTGLWTAYYLKKADPSLNVVIVERNFAGFGASGRNGGWLTGGFAWNHGRYLKDSSESAVRAMVGAMNGTVAEVLRVTEAEGIEADILPTDELMVATNTAQLIRMKEETEHRRHWGEEDRVFEISAEEANARVRVPGTLGGMLVRGVARVQPAKLVRGLAAVVEKLGVRIAEGTTVTGLGKGEVTTDRGIVRAPIILRCTEGFT
ncbi:MAG: FAD-dependent oxidoreductase, partial [Paracoccaceae bacterium]